MKMDKIDLVPDTDRIKRQVRHVMRDIKRNDLEISVRFSWLDVMLVAAGICIMIMSLEWIRRIDKKMALRRQMKQMEQRSEN